MQPRGDISRSRLGQYREQITTLRFPFKPSPMPPKRDNDEKLKDSSASPDVKTEPSINGDNDNSDGAKKKRTVTKRRKVNHACLYCRRSHMTCDEGRCEHST